MPLDQVTPGLTGEDRFVRGEATLGQLIAELQEMKRRHGDVRLRHIVIDRRPWKFAGVNGYGSRALEWKMIFVAYPEDK